MHLESSGRTGLLRKRSVPALRASLHVGPRYLAIILSISCLCLLCLKCQPVQVCIRCDCGYRHCAYQTRLRFGGRQPLCGTGVTSVIELISNPRLFRARTDESRPGPGPFTLTSSCFIPNSCAVRPAVSAATCAAKGVLLRLPLNPAPPEVAQATALPWRSVIVMMVLSKLL